MKAEEYRRMHVRKFAKQVKRKAKAQEKKRPSKPDPREVNFIE